jgi:hypothetical protein
MAVLVDGGIGPDDEPVVEERHRPARRAVGLGYVVALLGVVVATALRMIDYHVLEGALPFLTYFPAVMLAAL